MDRVFGTLGLPGRAAIPLLAAAGCNVPAIYGTRVLRTRRDRVIASFLVTLTPCSARSAVVIAALAPFAGVPAVLAAFGVVGATTIAAGLGANAMIPGRQPSLVLELAPLRRADPAPRGGQGVVAVQGLRGPGDADHGRRLARPWRGLRDRSLAGRGRGDRSGDRVAARPAGHRRRGHRLRVPAQGACPPAAARLRGGGARSGRGAGRAHGPRAAVRVRGGVVDLHSLRRDPRGALAASSGPGWRPGSRQPRSGSPSAMGAVLARMLGIA